jgi:translation elongation factor EF-G
MLDAVVDYLPVAAGTCPTSSGTKARAPKERSAASASTTEPCGLIGLSQGRIPADPTGDLTFVRVYSGVLAKAPVC